MADEKAVLMEVRDGKVVCSKCGGSVHCSGTVEVGFVPLEMSEEGLYHDWADAGSASFEPTSYSCVECGAILTDPGDLCADVNDLDEYDEYDNDSPGEVADDE